jgi:hypothetical protein
MGISDEEWKRQMREHEREVCRKEIAWQQMQMEGGCSKEQRARHEENIAYWMARLMED